MITTKVSESSVHFVTREQFIGRPAEASVMAPTAADEKSGLSAPFPKFGPVPTVLIQGELDMNITEYK